MTPPRGPKPETKPKQARVPVCLYLLPEVNAALADAAVNAGIAKGEIVEAALTRYLSQRGGGGLFAFGA